MLKKICSIPGVCSVLCVSMGCTLLASRTLAAQHQNQTGVQNSALNELAQAKDRLLKHGVFVPDEIDRIVRAGDAAAAIVELRQQFDAKQEQILRDASSTIHLPAPVDTLYDRVATYRIAGALVRLGDSGSTYWDYLIQGAADAISSDAPDPQAFDSKGKALQGPSAEYIGWANRHGLSVDAADEVITLNRAKIAFLGKSGDRRAIPLLRQALSSRDSIIQAYAARALAELNDIGSIPLIIQTCRAVPADAAHTIALQSLAHFQDAQAQSAAKEFQPVKNAN